MLKLEKLTDCQMMADFVIDLIIGLSIDLLDELFIYLFIDNIHIIIICGTTT